MAGWAGLRIYGYSVEEIFTEQKGMKEDLE